MQQVRQPAVAGTFYHSDRLILQTNVNDLLETAQLDANKNKQSENLISPKAIIVPHAGYIYSGPTAATAYARLSVARDTIKRVVLLGPVHRVPVNGLALPGASVFATPLGRVQVDLDAVAFFTADRHGRW